MKKYKEYTDTELHELATKKVCDKCGSEYHPCEWAYVTHVRQYTPVEEEVTIVDVGEDGEQFERTEVQKFDKIEYVENPADPHSSHSPGEHPNIPCQPRGIPIELIEVADPLDDSDIESS